MRWLVDGYNVIRRSPDLSSREGAGLEAGRTALCQLLAEAARGSGERFTVVFDGAGGGGAGLGASGVEVLFSSARETADQVLARMAIRGGAVVSNDREVCRAASRAGAISVTTDEFLARVSRLHAMRARQSAVEAPPDEDRDGEGPSPARKGNPRRLPKRRRAAARALGRLGPDQAPGRR
jgi:predicted RNA-binding protein with PIN domain